MEEIEVVINITKHEWEYLNKLVENGDQLGHYERLIVNGTTLPKGHGDLIERNKLEFLKELHDAKYGKISWGKAIKRIKYSAPTIIKADKTESEERNDNN